MTHYLLARNFNNRKHSLILTIDEYSFSFSHYDVNEGKMLQNLNENIKIEFIREVGKYLDDWAVNNLAWFIVSERLKKILEQFDLGTIQFLPLCAKSTDGKEKISNIYLCNICNLSDSLNLDNSDYFHFYDGSIGIKKYALNENKIECYDIFRLSGNAFSIFISDRLMKAMKKNKITGCSYGYVKMI